MKKMHMYSAVLFVATSVGFSAAEPVVGTDEARTEISRSAYVPDQGSRFLYETLLSAAITDDDIARINSDLVAFARSLASGFEAQKDYFVMGWFVNIPNFAGLDNPTEFDKIRFQSAVFTLEQLLSTCTAERREALQYIEDHAGQAAAKSLAEFVVRKYHGSDVPPGAIFDMPEGVAKRMEDPRFWDVFLGAIVRRA